MRKELLSCPRYYGLAVWKAMRNLRIKAKKGYDLASAQVSQKNLLYGIEDVSGIVCDSINGSVLPPYPVYEDRIIEPWMGT